jgi:TetR/AcrR family transcriptional regulator, regulator of autoinduction and epiphytic fitness
MSAARAQRSLDPRIERSRRVILDAALEELAAVGYGAFAIESVAARARVGKSTIYRLWPDRVALIADAFATMHRELHPDIASGTPRARLERVLRHIAEIASPPSLFARCIPAVIEGAERDCSLRRFHHRFQAEARQPLIALIAEGRAAGDFRADLDPELAALALLGAIFFRRLMTDEPFAPDRARDLVDTVLGGPVTVPRN